jgi:hypothetical protein
MSTEPVFSAAKVRAKPGPKPRPSSTACPECGSPDVPTFENEVIAHHPMHVNGFDGDGQPRYEFKTSVWCAGSGAKVAPRRSRKAAA